MIADPAQNLEVVIREIVAQVVAVLLVATVPAVNLPLEVIVRHLAVVAHPLVEAVRPLVAVVVVAHPLVVAAPVVHPLVVETVVAVV
jgi:hypothetical protein